MNKSIEVTLCHFRVLRLGLLQDGNIVIGLFAEGGEWWYAALAFGGLPDSE